jgi:hypothetical protein
LAPCWLRSLNHRDLAWPAADQALAQAREAGDLGLVGTIEFGRLKCLPTETPQVIAAQAARVADELQTSGNISARRGYGALHLSSALAAATALGRPGDISSINTAAAMYA